MRMLNLKGVRRRRAVRYDRGICQPQELSRRICELGKVKVESFADMEG
jgi:hypothetical protein